jgi:hypothetical protein
VESVPHPRRQDPRRPHALLEVYLLAHPLRDPLPVHPRCVPHLDRHRLDRRLDRHLPRREGVDRRPRLDRHRLVHRHHRQPQPVKLEAEIRVRIVVPC